MRPIGKDFSWSRGLLFFAVSLAFIYSASFSVVRYLGFNAEMLDLGHMSQAVWSATQGKPLVYTYIDGPLSDLSKQSEFIYFVLAPIYALFPSPVTLLVLQAGFFAAGAIPLYRLAHRRLNHPTYALLLAVIYLCYPVALTAVLFDFHGDTLGMPLLLFAIEALDRRSDREYLLWLVLSLSCKVYIAVPIIAMGAVLWIQKQRKYASLTWLAAFIWLGLILLVRFYLLPAELAIKEGASLQDYLAFYFGNLDIIPQTLPLRILGVLVALTPALLLGIHNLLWMAPGLLVALAVFTSTGPNNVYNYNYHHYALVVPFLIVGMVYGAEQLSRGAGNRFVKKLYGLRSWKKDIIFTTVLAGVFSAFFVPTPQSPFVLLYNPDNPTYKITSRDTFKRSWLEANVPESVPILADSYIAPHIANRNVLYANYYTDGPGYLYGDRLEQVLAEVEYVVLDAFSVYTRLHPETLAAVMQSADYVLERNQDGLLLFHRGGDALEQDVEIDKAANLPIMTYDFSDEIGLVGYDIEDLGGGRFHFALDWETLKKLGAGDGRMAVTRLEGVANTRIVHLPTFALQPPDSWPENSIVKEQFVYQIPGDVSPGRYALWLGWYDTQSPYLEATDDRSRVGEELQIGFLDVR